MIEITEKCTGELCASAIVSADGMEWREWCAYGGYSRVEVAGMFTRRMADMGYTIVGEK